VCSSDLDVARAHGAEVICTSVNQGTKAMAQNYVLSMVTSELVVTIDADTILASSAIEKTLPYFGNPKTASVCGFVVPQNIKTLWERGRFIEYLFGIYIFKGGQNNIDAVVVSSGCFSTFRTEILQKLGGFKARTMAEDMDFTWEVQNEGYHVYCAQDALCYPLDPSTFKVFVAQVDRWYRSFFQNLSIHRFTKNKKLGFVIYGELAYAFMEPLLLLGYAMYTKNILSAFALGILIDFVIVAIPCIIKGTALGMLKATLVSLPMYFMIRPINQYLFWRSLWKEWIKKERLSTWSKGH
jgi:biofilm PGA synthesis N-glycosyltransferase PgaC